MKALCAVALAATFGYVSPAAADPVRITAGALEYSAPFDFSELTLTGSMGFTFSGQPGTGVFEPLSCAVALCQGDLLSLRAEWSGLDLGGMATLNETAYERVGSLSSNTAMVAQFFGTMMAPRMPGERTIGTARFSFEGRFFIEGVPESTVVQLVGEGLATASFRRVAGSDAWRLDGLRYDFADTSPVPEPSTLLLFLAGAACARALRSSQTRGSARDPGSVASGAPHPAPLPLHPTMRKTHGGGPGRRRAVRA